MADNKRVFIYIRVSTREQANEGYSIKEQEVRLRAYAKSRGYKIIKVYIDPGHSGANLDRPALQEMLKEINNADLVLVYKLDRLSRSQKDTLHLIEEVFLKNGVDFNSISESFDTSTPFGRAVIGILSVFAQLEREQIKERLMMGRTARAKEGYYHGGDAAKMLTGYDYVDGELIINEYEAECVKYIFDEYLSGKGITRIFKSVEEKFPGVIAHRSTIRKILIRPAYKGQVVFGGEKYKGKHVPIITKEKFEVTQRLMSKRSEKFDNTPDSPYILSGLLYCEHCNARMAGKAGKKLKNGETMKYYVCYTRRGTPRYMMTADSCDKSFERKEPLEDAVLNQLKNLNLKEIEMKAKDHKNTDKIKVLSNEIKSVDNQISKTVDLFSLGTIPMDILNDKIKKLNKSKEKIENHLAELRTDQPLDIGYLKEDIIKSSTIDKLNPTEQQMIVVKLIDKITVSNDKLKIEWVF